MQLRPCTESKVRETEPNQQYLNSLQWDHMVNIMCGGTLGAMWSELEKYTDQDYDTIEYLNPVLFAVKANADDKPTWNQATETRMPKATDRLASKNMMC